MLEYILLLLLVGFGSGVFIALFQNINYYYQGRNSGCPSPIQVLSPNIIYKYEYFSTSLNATQW